MTTISFIKPLARGNTNIEVKESPALLQTRIRDAARHKDKFITVTAVREAGFAWRDGDKVLVPVANIGAVAGKAAR